MKDIKRYSLALPSSTYNKIKEVAQEEEKTILQIFKEFLKIGLYVYECQKEGKRVVIEDGKKRKEIFIL